MRVRYEHPSHLASKLFKCGWVMNTASPLTFTRFVGKHVFPRPNAASEIKVSVAEIFRSLFCTLCGLWLQVSSTTRLEKHTMHTVKFRFYYYELT